VTHPLRLLQLNLAYDPTLANATALLSRYHTMTGWSRSLRRAGALVDVVQRFNADSTIVEDDVTYTFVNDGSTGMLSPWTRGDGVVDAVANAQPDVVHVNGLMFPGMVKALRSRLPAQTAIVLQDHSGFVPRSAIWPLSRWSAARWRIAFEAADACTFTARELADRWYAVGLPRAQVILEIPEASTNLTPVSTDEARRATGISASPAILWVGRLHGNKDPLTVLDALEAAMARMPAAHCWMIYNGGDLEDAVRQRLDGSAVLRRHVTMVGAVAHEKLAGFFSAADIFVSGSRHEGSGYALIEAMACGVTPCVTNIAAFRALTAGCGALWAPGDATACAVAIEQLATHDREAARRLVAQRFENALSWDAIGRLTLKKYGELVKRRAGGGPL
jgi:glycosyltransferase involved in cell wall biosynthesis